MSTDQFWEIFLEELEPIDRILALRGSPVHMRPWEAVFFFWAHSVIDVRGFKKEDVYKHPMFREMLLRSRGWFVDKYGEASVARDSEDGLAMVLVHETPFALRFPLTVTRPAKKKGLAALHYPRRLLRGEDSLNFIERPPNLSAMCERELAAIRRKASRVVGLARSLNSDTLFLRRDDPGSALASRIRVSLDKGIGDICSEDNGRLSSSVWELNLAAEMALKVLLAQHSMEVPRIHSVRRLAARAEAGQLVKLPRSWIERFPSASDAIRCRYGEGPVPSVGYVDNLYFTSLQLCAKCAVGYKRLFSVGPRGAVLYLKSPWS